MVQKQSMDITIAGGGNTTIMYSSDIFDDSDNEKYRHRRIITLTTMSHDGNYAFVSVDTECRHLQRATTIIGVIYIIVGGNAEW